MDSRILIEAMPCVRVWDQSRHWSESRVVLEHKLLELWIPGYLIKQEGGIDLCQWSPNSALSFISLHDAVVH